MKSHPKSSREKDKRDVDQQSDKGRKTLTNHGRNDPQETAAVSEAASDLLVPTTTNMAKKTGEKQPEPSSRPRSLGETSKGPGRKASSSDTSRADDSISQRTDTNTSTPVVGKSVFDKPEISQSKTRLEETPRKTSEDLKSVARGLNRSQPEVKNHLRRSRSKVDCEGDRSMQSHFSSFTPEAMRAFGQQLNEDLESRKQYIESIRRSTNEMLAESHRKQQESEALRRQSARQDADNRRVHFSELRSEVRSFCNRVELKRKDVVADLQHLRQELNSASMAFRNRGSN